MLILASGSSYRRELLSRLTPDPICVTPDVDEDAVKSEGLPPDALARRLAMMKAQTVLRRFPDATVIGSDQLVNLNGVVLGKPGTTDAAVEQLLQMAGQPHDLLTAVAVISADRTHEFLSTTRLWMRSIRREEAAQYVARDNPVDCAGSYKIESAGILLFDRIETDDFTSIIGLPLLELGKELRRRGCLS